MSIGADKTEPVEEVDDAAPEAYDLGLDLLADDGADLRDEDDALW